jgi:branched-chain amino acid transport system substrate-binding protein
MRNDLGQPFDLVFSEGLQQGIIDRPVEIVYREVEGLPKGSVKAVIDAYGELVDEGCLVVFGPHITENAVPTREAIEERFRVPAINVCGSDDWLGEWTFAFPQGSMTDEPIFWSDLLAKGGHTEVGVLAEQSLVGESYLKNLRNACRRKGIRIVAEASIAQTAQDINDAVRTLYEAKAQAVVHCGFGFGIVFINPALESLNWDPPRFTSTAFQNAWISPVLWNAFLGWTGVDLRAAPAVLRTGGEPRRRHDAAARVHRRPSTEPARRQGGPRTGENAACCSGRTRHQGLVRKVDPSCLDGRWLPGRQNAGPGRRQLPSRRPLR